MISLLFADAIKTLLGPLEKGVSIRIVGLGYWENILIVYIARVRRRRRKDRSLIGSLVVVVVYI